MKNETKLFSLESGEYNIALERAGQFDSNEQPSFVGTLNQTFVGGTYEAVYTMK